MLNKFFKKEKKLTPEEIKEISWRLKYGYPLISLVLLILVLGGFGGIFVILARKIHQALTTTLPRKEVHFHLEKIEKIEKKL